MRSASSRGVPGQEVARPGQLTSSAPGMASARVRAADGGTTTSQDPATTTVGTATSGQVVGDHRQLLHQGPLLGEEGPAAAARRHPTTLRPAPRRAGWRPGTRHPIRATDRGGSPSPPPLPSLRPSPSPGPSPSPPTTARRSRGSTTPIPTRPATVSASPSPGTTSSRSSPLTLSGVPTDPTSTSPRTRSGCRAAIRTATPPAQLWPTTVAGAAPRSAEEAGHHVGVGRHPRGPASVAP